MNKLAIPSLLLGVVMIAAAFAFMPVQEASTVHTTILAGSMEPFAAPTAAVATASGGQLTATFTCTSGQTCVIYDAIVHITADPNATADVFYIESVTVNSVKLTGADLAAPTNDEHIQVATGSTIGLAADIVISTTAASNIPSSALQTLGAIRGESSGATPITLNSAETMTVVVQSSSGDTATSIVTFYGAMTGGSAPATPAFA